MYSYGLPDVFDGRDLPSNYRCGGTNPAMSWSPGPGETKSYAIFVEDLTAGVTLWALWDVPANLTLLPPYLDSNIAPAKQNQQYRFVSPCAAGRTYRFSLYALAVEALVGLPSGSAAGKVKEAAGAARLATAGLTVTIP